MPDNVLWRGNEAPISPHYMEVVGETQNLVISYSENKDEVNHLAPELFFFNFSTSCI